MGLTLRVLEALPGPLVTVLLPFLLPRIAREKAGLAYRRPKLGIDRHERPGDAEPDRAGLPDDAAAHHADDHVEASLRVRHRERLAHHGQERSLRQMLFDGPVVDGDRAGSRHEAHPR